MEHCYKGQVSTSIVDIAKEHWFRPVTRMDEALSLAAKGWHLAVEALVAHG